jgi:phosphonate transport system substrate-binding protein
MSDSILLGAVAYDPKVVTIWEGIRDYFRGEGVDFDFALFSNYERQVDTLVAGHIDIAWNTPLGHVRVQRRTEGRSRSLGMRDSDRDFHAKIVVRKDAGIRTLADLAGKTLAVGSRDSTQARILPLYFLRQQGVALDNVQLLPFDTDLGKHGDTGDSELRVLRAVREGKADAGALGDVTWALLRTESPENTEGLEVFWRSPAYYHCNFTALPSFERGQQWTEALLAMSYDDPSVRVEMELEGVKRWLPGDKSGYADLTEAMRQQGYIA